MKSDRPLPCLQDAVIDSYPEPYHWVFNNISPTVHNWRYIIKYCWFVCNRKEMNTFTLIQFTLSCIILYDPF
jgi:hypothetical protein